MSNTYHGDGFFFVDEHSGCSCRSCSGCRCGRGGHGRRLNRRCHAVLRSVTSDANQDGGRNEAHIMLAHVPQRRQLHTHRRVLRTPPPALRSWTSVPLTVLGRAQEQACSLRVSYSRACQLLASWWWQRLAAAAVVVAAAAAAFQDTAYQPAWPWPVDSRDTPCRARAFQDTACRDTFPSVDSRDTACRIACSRARAVRSRL